jgi:thioredoxin 1
MSDLDNILQGNKYVLVDFYADWCGPCGIMKPIVHELESEYKGRVFVKCINVDDDELSAAKYGIRSIPTLIMFKSEKIYKQFIGVKQKIILQTSLDDMLASED